MTARPTTEFEVVVLDVLDDTWDQLIGRLDGLSDTEYLWEPVASCWTVRARVNGSVTVDGEGERDRDPAPVTTIAWRLWHIAVDCLDGYSERLLGATGASVSGDEWHLRAVPAVDDLDRAWRCFRNGLAEFTAERWWAQLGDGWGPWSRHSVLDVAVHALHEIAHHGAEVALLRDLYRDGLAVSKSSGLADIRQD